LGKPSERVGSLSGPVEAENKESGDGVRVVEIAEPTAFPSKPIGLGLDVA